MSALALTDARAFAASLDAEIRSLSNLGYKVLDTPEHSLSLLLEQYEAFVFDIDGVLLWGSAALAAVGDAVQQLRRQEKRLVFLTNTAAKSRRSCAEGLRRAGIEVYEEEVITMAYAAAVFVREAHPEASVAFGIGEAAMKEEFAASGILLLYAKPQGEPERQHVQQLEGPLLTADTVEHSSTAKKCNGCSGMQEQQEIAAAAGGAIIEDCLDPRVSAVVVGWDRAFDYHKMALACLYLQQKKPSLQQHAERQGHLKEERDAELGNLPFVATNRDAYNRINGLRHPANGAQLAAIEAVVGRQAHSRVGKLPMQHRRHRVQFTDFVVTLKVQGTPLASFPDLRWFNSNIWTPANVDTTADALNYGIIPT
ncbi:phosphoglycolate phosphatase 1B, chloroplastic [Cyclospora cayetanensis]|uniref:Phosphoglycolate phosphatase 1B, chloroplastic n=1 Tax=Cyclospora cayetanensis TaxID=88456 RepID=A0A6P5WCL9_9EIME|nr:phosphoglycolate phosphatase 1B, chloroplastic [Cyclospora cayetanensis]